MKVTLAPKTARNLPMSMRYLLVLNFQQPPHLTRSTFLAGLTWLLPTHLVGPHHPALVNLVDRSAALTATSTQRATGDGSPDTSYEPPSMLFSSGVGGGVSSATSLCSSRPNESIMLPPILPPRHIQFPNPSHPPIVETADACVEAVPERQREYEQLEVLFKNRGRVIEQMRVAHEEQLKEARALRHRTTLAESELEASRRQQSDISNRLASAQHELDTLRATEQRLVQERSELVVEHTAAKQRAVQLEAEMHSLQDQLVAAYSLDSLTKAKATQDHVITALRARADQESAALRAELDAAQERIESMTGELASARTAVDAAQSERAAQLARQAEQLEAAQARVAELLASTGSHEVGGLRLQIDQLTAAKAITDDLNQVLQQDARDLREQLAMLETARDLGATEDTVRQLDFTEEQELPIATNVSSSSLSDKLATSMELEPAEHTVALLRHELTRCLNNYSIKRAQVASLQKEMFAARRDADEWRRRAERSEQQVTEQRHELLSVERRLSELSAAGPSAREVQAVLEVERLSSTNQQLESSLAELRRRLEELVDREECLSKAKPRHATAD